MNWFRGVIPLIALVSAGFAAEVEAPSNLKAKALGANSFLLRWKDKSDNETGWEIRASVGEGSEPQSYRLLKGENIRAHVLIANSLPGKLVRFQVRAYRGEDPDRVYSAPSPIAEATALPKALFQAAENVVATAIDDASIRLRWEDPSTTESGYFIQIRKGAGKWEDLGNTGVQSKYAIPIDSLEPATSYSFRVAAFKSDSNGQITAITPLSNETTVKTDAFRAPFGLQAKSEGEGRISLAWKERSSAEDGYEVQAKAGNGKFKSLGSVGANQTETNPISLKIATPYDFRVRAFRSVEGKKKYSGFSNVASKKSSGLAIPTDLAVSATTESSVSLTWKDMSARETGYALYYKEKGKKLPKIIELPAGSTAHTVSGLKVGRLYEFKVRAFDKKTASRYSDVVEGTTRDQLLGNYDVSLTAGVAFAFDVEVNQPAQVENVTVSDLPAGLTLDEATLSISGVVTTPGVYEANVKVKFKAGYEIERELILRVVAQEGGPLAEGSFAHVEVAKGAAKDVSLNGKFRDSDVSAARRFTTNLGTFDIVLYEDATPKTVENFLAYADDGRYENTFFHRAPAGFVVQGGGFTHNGSAFGKVDTFAPVQNEPGISNVEGTVAMAKLGGDPNSATSQFFINLSDENASNLDFQNGGFTVFGRIAGDGMDLFQDIDALPKGNYTISAGGDPMDLDDVPVNTSFPAPATLNPATLVKVTNVAAAPILSYTVTSLSPAIATASITGNTVRVTGVKSGTAKIRVRATDLDGLYAEQIFDVTVP